jgi:chromosome segregation ATPase
MSYDDLCMMVVIAHVFAVVVQMLEDPSNLFVVELASQSSENAGVSQHLQVMCCLFLGCVFESFAESPTSTEPDSLSRNSILAMIDAKIGLSRFSDLIKIPTAVTSLSARQHHSDGANNFSFSDSPEDVYFVEAYQKFYKSQVRIIKTAIYSFYSGSGNASIEDDSTSSETKIIKMQIETIAELELELKRAQSSPNSAEDSTAQVQAVECDDKVNALKIALASKEEDIDHLRSRDARLQEQVRALTSQLHDLSGLNDALACKHASDTEEASSSMQDLQSRLDAAESIANKLENENRSLLEKEGNFVVDGTQLSQKDAEIVLLKEEVLSLLEGKRIMTDEVKTTKRQLHLLEEELKSPMPFEKINENKISGLEKRNTDLKTQVWEMESVVKSMQMTFAAESSTIQTAVVDLVHLLEAEGEVGDMQNFSQCVEVCVDIINRLSGRCSDIAESLEICFDSFEDKPVERVLECIDKLSNIVRREKMKVLEGERFRCQLVSAEDDLERLQADYDTAFSRLGAVEEDNTTLQVEMDRLKKEHQAALLAEAKLRVDSNLEQNESQTQRIVELELQIVDFENQKAGLLERNKEVSDSLKEVEEAAAHDREEFIVAKDLTSIEINRLMHELEEQRKVSSESSGMGRTIEEMTVELDHYKGQFARLEEEHAANLALHAALSDEYAQLQVECRDKQREVERVESDEAMLEELRSDFRHLAEQHDLLQHQMREAETTLAGKEVLLQASVAEKDELQNSFEKKADEYKSLLERFISQKEDVLHLTAKADSLTCQMAEKEKQAAAEPDFDRTAAGKIAGLNDVIRGLELEVDDLCSEKENQSRYYTTELQKVRDDFEKLSSETHVRDGELLAAKNTIAELEESSGASQQDPPPVSLDVVRSVSSRLVALGALISSSGGEACWRADPDLAAASQALLCPREDADLPAALAAMDRYIEAFTKQLQKPAPPSQVCIYVFQYININITFLFISAIVYLYYGPVFLPGNGLCRSLRCRHMSSPLPPTPGPQ